MPGAQPLVSRRLAGYLQLSDDLVNLREDDFDRLIAAERLRIGRFAFFRELDLFLIILTNRRVISRRLSAYSLLEKATDYQLNDYVISETGIHWPSVDADLSLRGFLLEDAVSATQPYNSSSPLA